MLNISNQLILDGFEAPRPKRPVSTGSGKKKFKKQDLEFIPMVSVSPDYFCLYTKVVNHAEKFRNSLNLDPDRAAHKQKLLDDLNKARDQKKKEGATGVSRSGRVKFRQRCGYLFHIAPKQTITDSIRKFEYNMRLNFITLTLTASQIQGDKTIKKTLFKNWIDAVRKRFPGISYVWRAEVQENGNLHFHILTDHYMPVNYVNGLWLSALRRNGYPVISDPIPDPLNKGLFIYKELNPVHIKKVQNEKQLGKYMRKYMLKGLDDSKLPELRKKLKILYTALHFAETATKRYDLEVQMSKLKKAVSILERRKIFGRLWGSSDNLAIKPFSQPVAVLGKFFPKLIDYYKDFWNSAYTRVHYIDDFEGFLNRWAVAVTDNFADALADHLARLFPKIRCPFSKFDAYKNYTYG